MSLGTSVGSTQGCSFTCIDFPNRSTISDKRILTCRSGLVLKSFLQTGHLYLTFSSQNLVIQVLQKLCPHGVVTGLLNTSRQMGHEKFSSDQEVLAEAIPRHRRQGLCIEKSNYSCHSITGREVLTNSQSSSVLLTLLLVVSLRLFDPKWVFFFVWKRQLLPRRLPLVSMNLTFFFPEWDVLSLSSPLAPPLTPGSAPTDTVHWRFFTLWLRVHSCAVIQTHWCVFKYVWNTKHRPRAVEKPETLLRFNADVPL